MNLITARFKRFRAFLIPVAAIALAALINLFWIVNAHISSASMEPTIPTGSFVIGVRGAYANHEPSCGDIVFFHKIDVSDHLLIKRVIALPGQTFEISDGEVYINGAKLPEPYLSAKSTDNFPLTTVPENAYILLGDNRANSQDARNWGDPFVYREDIVARAESIWFPTLKTLKTGVKNGTN